MTTIFMMQSAHGLADLQFPGGFQYYDSRTPSQRRLWQLGEAARNTYGVSSRCLSCHKPGLWSAKLEQDYDSYDRGRSRKTLSEHRKGDLESRLPSGSLKPPRALNSESASTSTTTATEAAQELQQNAEPKEIAERGVEQEHGADGGLSALDAYFSKLKKTAEVPGNVSRSNSLSAVVLPLSKQHNSALASAGHVALATSTDAGEDLHGLKALDAYFEKLNPKKPGLSPSL